MEIFSAFCLTSDTEMMPDEARRKMQEACAVLPIQKCIFKFHHNADVLRACIDECMKNHVETYLLHPLLIDDGVLFPLKEWYVTGIAGEQIAGTIHPSGNSFFCPNKESVRRTILQHITSLIQEHHFNGIVLDAITYPSPLQILDSHLSCFCGECHEWAGTDGFDIEGSRHQIKKLIGSSKGIEKYLTLLINPDSEYADDPACHALDEFLRFRTRSITRLIKYISDCLYSQDYMVGCISASPSTSYALGQDIHALNYFSDWLAIMFFTHYRNQGGIIQELSGTIQWLMQNRGYSEKAAITMLSQALKLTLPNRIRTFMKQGLSHDIMRQELNKVFETESGALYAGIPYTFFHNKNDSEEQPGTLLNTIKETGCSGLMLTHDILDIPLDTLTMIRSELYKEHIG